MALDQPKVVSIKEMIQQQVEDSIKTRFSLLEGMAKTYIEKTGMNPREMVLVEQMGGTGRTFFYFTTKRELGIDYGRSEDRTVAQGTGAKRPTTRDADGNQRRDGNDQGGQL